MKVCLLLFFELFRIALFVIGGGYAILAVADQAFAKRKWTRDGELLDELPVFQMIPGIIAAHTAVYIGRKVAGAKGAVIGVAAVALPSVIVFTLVSMGYDSLPLDSPHVHHAFVGLRAALAGIVGATVMRSWAKTERDLFFYVVLAAALFALFVGVAVWAVLVAAMAAGLARAFSPTRHGADTAAERPRIFKSFAWLPILCFLKYGLLCFGGGFVLVPMYIEDFVGPSAHTLNVTAAEFSNLMALTQMTPGPIGVNGATYFGFRLGGVPGAVLASAALLLPGSVLLYCALASIDRFKTSRIVRGVMTGTKPASFALMLSALWSFLVMSLMDGEAFSPFSAVLVVACAFAAFRQLIGPVSIILLSGLASLVWAGGDWILNAL